jgi:hypothetical protein
VIITPLLDKKRTTGLLHQNRSSTGGGARDGFVLYLFIRPPGAKVRAEQQHTNFWGVIFFN